MGGAVSPLFLGLIPAIPCLPALCSLTGGVSALAGQGCTRFLATARAGLSLQLDARIQGSSRSQPPPDVVGVKNIAWSLRVVERCRKQTLLLLLLLWVITRTKRLAGWVKTWYSLRLRIEREKVCRHKQSKLPGRLVIVIITIHQHNNTALALFSLTIRPKACEYKLSSTPRIVGTSVGSAVRVCLEALSV